MSFKKFFKNIRKLAFLQEIIAFLAVGYLWLVRFTTRLSIENQHHLHPFWSGEKPLIFIFWHRKMLLAPFAWPTRAPFFMLISPQTDGQIIRRIIRWFGIHTVHGGSSHGKGPASLRTLVRHLHKGHTVGITPDGPRGPCYQIKPGVFFTALASQCPIIAVSFACTHKRCLRSWDRFVIPLPFGRACLGVSAPIEPPTHKDQEQDFTQRIQRAMEQAHTVAKQGIQRP